MNDLLLVVVLAAIGTAGGVGASCLFGAWHDWKCRRDGGR